MTRPNYPSAYPHGGQLNRRVPWIVRAWRAADWLNRCIAIGMVAITSGVTFHHVWSSFQ